MGLRNDEDREINHHGRPVEVCEAEFGPDGSMVKVTDKDLVAVNEQVQLKALKDFYDRADNMRERKKRRLERCQRFTLVYNPILALAFVAVYWSIGLSHAY